MISRKNRDEIGKADCLTEEIPALSTRCNRLRPSDSWVINEGAEWITSELARVLSAFARPLYHHDDQLIEGVFQLHLQRERAGKRRITGAAHALSPAMAQNADAPRLSNKIPATTVRSTDEMPAPRVA